MPSTFCFERLHADHQQPKSFLSDSPGRSVTSNRFKVPHCDRYLQDSPS